MAAPIGLAGDARALQSLRSTASQDPKAAVKEAAKQFEAVFMQELMKSMRGASLKSDLFDNEGSELATEMLDAQYATAMSGRPGSLADLIARQLSRHMGGAEAATPQDLTLRLPPAFQKLPQDVAAPKGGGKQAQFLREHWNAAQAASRDTGIPAEFILAQAAHESGWGRRDIRRADGSASFNVFGIKAGPSWKGDVAEVTTTEYIGGQPRKVKAKFRAYASAEEAFRDYARLLKNNERYAKVIENSRTAQGFAQGMQQAGYATDPQYAAKLSRIINATLQLQRAHT